MRKSAKKVSTSVGEDLPEGFKDSFGPALKKARRIRQIALGELADIVGCSASTLSKIENQKAAPSLGMLCRISQALRMDVTTLLQSRAATKSLVTRAVNHPVWRTTGLEVTSLLPPRPEHRMESYVLCMTPGTRSDKPIAHGPGELFGVVLEGNLKLAVDGKTYNVESGDSFAFTYDRPHAFANPGTRKTRVLFVMSPPVDFKYDLALRSRATKGK